MWPLGESEFDSAGLQRCCFAVLSVRLCCNAALLCNTQECDWTQEDRDREQRLLSELVSVIDQRNLIVSSLDQDMQRLAHQKKTKRYGRLLNDGLGTLKNASLSRRHQGTRRGQAVRGRHPEQRLVKEEVQSVGGGARR